MIVIGAIVSNALGFLAFKLVHQACVTWSGDVQSCVIVGPVQLFVVMHVHLVPVLVSAFAFFLVSCRVGRADDPTLLALGSLVYAALSWLLSQWWAPEDAMAVVFGGASALVYFHWRQRAKSPNNALHATRENARA
jgi:hypothetical protein